MVYIIERRSLFWDCCKAILKGVGFFFPAFFLSLFVTIPWSRHYWAGEAQAPLGGIAVSFYIGILAAILCLIYLLVEAFREHREMKLREARQSGRGDDLEYRSGHVEDRK
jgi:hypothetical protein